MFALLARTGLRLGEALALQWGDLDLAARSAWVQRARTEAGTIKKPKSGHGRLVDLSRVTVETLRRLEHERKAETLRRAGWRETPPWVFCTSEGTPFDHANIAKAFKRTLVAAELPAHFSTHGLRHTYASLLLQAGESPVYVQRQLGHSQITLTVDTYGRWLPDRNPAAVDRLDDLDALRHGSKVVAAGG